MRMNQLSLQRVAMYHGYHQPIPFHLRTDIDAKVETSEWVSESERGLEALLEERPLDLHKQPEFVADSERLRAPSSSTWVNRGAELPTDRLINNVRSSKVIGFNHSRTSNGMMPVESTLEADAGILLDWSAATTGLGSQPPKLHYELNGARRATTPDFGFQLEAKRHLVEIKPFNRACEHEQVSKFKNIHRAAAAQGIKYSVLTERVIRRQPRLQNIVGLRTYASFQVSRTWANLLLRTLSTSAEGLTYGQLEQRFRESWSVARPTLLCLVYFRVLEIDWNLTLDNDTVVSLQESDS